MISVSSTVCAYDAHSRLPSNNSLHQSFPDHRLHLLIDAFFRPRSGLWHNAKVRILAPDGPLHRHPISFSERLKELARYRWRIWPFAEWPIRRLWWHGISKQERLAMHLRVKNHYPSWVCSVLTIAIVNVYIKNIMPMQCSLPTFSVLLLFDKRLTKLAWYASYCLKNYIHIQHIVAGSYKIVCFHYMVLSKCL